MPTPYYLDLARLAQLWRFAPVATSVGWVSLLYRASPLSRPFTLGAVPSGAVPLTASGAVPLTVSGAVPLQSGCGAVPPTASGAVLSGAVPLTASGAVPLTVSGAVPLQSLHTWNQLVRQSYAYCIGHLLGGGSPLSLSSASSGIAS